MFKVSYKWNLFADLIVKNVDVSDLEQLQKWQEENRLRILGVDVLA